MHVCGKKWNCNRFDGDSREMRKHQYFWGAIATQKGSPFIDSDMAYETKSLFSLIYSKQKTYLFWIQYNYQHLYGNFRIIFVNNSLNRNFLSMWTMNMRKVWEKRCKVLHLDTTHLVYNFGMNSLDFCLRHSDLKNKKKRRKILEEKTIVFKWSVQYKTISHLDKSDGFLSNANRHILILKQYWIIAEVNYKQTTTKLFFIWWF